MRRRSRRGWSAGTPGGGRLSVSMAESSNPSASSFAVSRPATAPRFGSSSAFRWRASPAGIERVAAGPGEGLVVAHVDVGGARPTEGAAGAAERQQAAHVRLVGHLLLAEAQVALDAEDARRAQLEPGRPVPIWFLAGFLRFNG